MIGTNLAITTKNYAVAGGVTYDADALAYFTANTAITSAADKTAINTFYLGLKSDGIYTKMKAMYLPIWGSAASSKWNLVNPLDANAAFRLTFSTGWTFSSGGMTPLNAYANTNLKAAINLSQNNTHLSYYSRTNNTGFYDIGHSWTSETSLIYLQSRAADGKSYFRLNAQNTGGTESSQTVTDSLGLFTINRTSSTVQSIIKNSTKYDFNINSFGLPANDIFLGLLFINPNNYYGNKQCAFSSIGNGLTNTEATNFYTRVNTLMTYFGINV